MAAATARSALATSGRRSSSEDGKPTSIGGGLLASDAGSTAKREARLAQQHGDGVLELRALQPHVGELRARVLTQRFGLVHIGRGGDAAVVAILRQVVGAVEGLHGVFEQLDVGVGAAQGEVVRGKLGAQREVDGGEIGGAGLRAIARGRRGVAQAAEESISHAKSRLARKSLPVAMPRRSRRVAGDCGRARGRGVRVDGREQVRAGAGRERAGLVEARDGGAKVLAAVAELGLQVVELRVAEGLSTSRHGPGCLPAWPAPIRRLPCRW